MGQVLMTRATVILATVTLGLVACGGGSSVAPAPTPSSALSGTAADCFNPQLFAAGTTYQIDYELFGNILGTTTDRITVQAASAGSQDVLVTTQHQDNFSTPVPSANSRVVQRRALQSTEGLVIVTNEDFTTYASGLVAHVAYQPPLRDPRFGLLSAGDSFLLVRNIVAPQPSSFSSTVTYLGQETVTVPAGTYTACKFEESQQGSGVRWTWVLKGKGIVAKIQDMPSGASEQLMATSRLNGEPI